MTGAVRPCPVCRGPLPGGAAPVAGLVFALPQVMGPVVAALAGGRALPAVDLARRVNDAAVVTGEVTAHVLSVRMCQSRAALAALGWQIVASVGHNAIWRMTRLPGCVAALAPDVAPGAVACPCCGGGVVGGEAAAEVPVAALQRAVSPLLAQLVGALLAANGARARDLAGVVFADHDDGGPLFAVEALRNARRLGAAQMAALGWQIAILGGNKAARWVLLPLRPQAVR